MARFLPFPHLQVLDIVVPQRGDITLTLSAMQALTSLRELRLYTRCKVKKVKVTSLVQAMGDMKTVTSLTLGVQGLRACLPSEALLHLTSLSLSGRVSVPRLPQGLRKLRLQNFGRPDNASEWAEKLQTLADFESLCLDECTEEALLRLPCNLRSLVLQAQSDKPVHCVFNPKYRFSAALGRVNRLQSLCIGCFFTTELFESLNGVVLPEVHTFGFQLPSVIMGDDRCIQDGGVTNFKPDNGVVEMPGIFPRLQTMKIIFQEDCLGLVHGVVELESAFMTPELFPGLRHIVCCCQMLDLKLNDISPLCQVTSL
ncbi:hypothetical protein ABBQ38_001449 [Trebouxia sp. C0009 RCD-2024]